MRLLSGRDLANLNHGKLLTVPLLLVIAFAAAHLPDDLLDATLVLDDVDENLGTSHHRRSDGHLALVAQEQHSFKNEGLTGFHGEQFNFQFFSGRNTILFPAGFQYSVHNVGSGW